MKNIQKEIPQIVGLVATTALAVVSGGLINPAATSILSGISNVGSSMGASLAANLITKFSPNKMRNWLKEAHPDNLNHHVKKLFEKSIKEALDNVFILFLETNNAKEEKKEVKKLIKDLQKRLSDMFLKAEEIQLDEEKIKHFLYENDKEEKICRFIENQFDNFGIIEPFKSFLAENLPAQIQLCFGEGLKDPANRNAWIAFQRMLTEEIRNDIKQIAKDTESIKEDLSDLKFTKSGFSEEQIAEIRQLTKILNDKKLVEVKMRSGVNQSLKSIEDKANKIIQITTKTQLTVEELKGIVEKMRRQNKMIYLLVFSLSACLLVAGLFVAYKLVNQPFTATVQLYGWEGKQHNPLEGKGILVLTLGDKTERAEISRQGEAIFKGIPPQYKGKTVSVHLTDTENEPYYLTDSLIQIRKGEKSEVQVRLRGLEKLEGVIVDENGMGIADATVFVAGIKGQTDERGYFKIAIPTAKQQRTQEVEILKDGYTPYRNIAMPMTDDMCRIVLPNR